MANDTEKIVSGFVVFFGVGGSAKAYCQNTNQLPDYFCDNDQSLWGTHFHGIEIISPQQLASKPISQIVLTSSYVVDILQQLSTLGIPSDVVHVPAKSEWSSQPFQSPARRKKVLALVQQLQQSGCSRYPCVVVGGACLGILRNNDLIPWDDDIDFRADVYDFNAFKSYLEKNHLTIRVEDGLRRSIVSAWQVDDSPVDFSITFYDGDTPFHLDTFDRYEWRWPSEMFRFPFAASVQECTILLPNPPEHYLTQVYGSDWSTPKENFSALDYNTLDSNK